MISGRIGAFAGVPIVESWMVPDGVMVILTPTVTYVAEPGQVYRAKWIRWYVRDRMRDVCDWLGEPVGDEPLTAVEEIRQDIAVRGGVI